VHLSVLLLVPHLASESAFAMDLLLEKLLELLLEQQLEDLKASMSVLRKEYT
jgi:hypothetical protein